MKYFGAVITLVGTGIIFFNCAAGIPAAGLVGSIFLCVGTFLMVKK